jgi:hypothetical protein
MSPQTHSPTVQVERLRLKLTGLDEHAARQFARLVAENLDVKQQPATVGHGGASTARQVAAEVLAALFAQAAPLPGEL